jgi:penicillin-binding protein 2A
VKLWGKLLIVAGITVPVVTGACIAGFMLFIEHTSINLSKLTTTPKQTIVYDKSGHVYMKIGAPPSNLTFNQLPKDLTDAVVATEDHAYWSGYSIDVRSILRSLFVDFVTRSSAQGASTIQEQLAKIVYLNDNKTLSYKLKEIAMGVQISRYFTKKQILAMYLDKVFLGENSVGAREAAMRYFGVDILHHPQALTLDQAALLAGLPQAPSAYDPLTHPKAAIQRRNQVLQNMVKYGYITSTEAASAERAPLGVKYHPIANDGWNTHPLFANVLFDYAARHGISTAQLLQGGLEIYTTISPSVQQAVHTVFWSKNYNGDFPGPTSGTVVEGGAVFVDPKTGGILGAAGSRKQGYTRLGIDRIYSNSSPGSSIKPVMEYAAAIQSGNWTPASILDNQPQNFGDGYRPQNWEGPNGPKKVTLQYGLEESQNIASVWLLQHVGLAKGTRFAMNDGIKLTTRDRQQLGVAIGGMQYGVNPLEMAQAYEAFDNGGIQQRVHLLTRIVNQDGQNIFKYTPSSKVVMSPATAMTMTSLMEDVVDYGTGTSAQIQGWGVAGKTGTVQYSAGLYGHFNWVKDAWFDGYTPNMVGSVYIGYDQSTPQHHMTMSPLDPSANTARIFRDITRLAEQHKRPEQFAQGPLPAWQGTASAVQAVQNPLSGLVAKWSTTNHLVQLSWKSLIGGNTSVIVSRVLTGTTNTPSQIAQVSGASYQDSSAQAGFTYTYLVQAVNTNGTPQGNILSATLTIPFTGPIAGIGNSSGNGTGVAGGGYNNFAGGSVSNSLNGVGGGISNPLPTGNGTSSIANTQGP